MLYGWGGKHMAEMLLFNSVVCQKLELRERHRWEHHLKLCLQRSETSLPRMNGRDERQSVGNVCYFPHSQHALCVLSQRNAKLKTISSDWWFSTGAEPWQRTDTSVNAVWNGSSADMKWGSGWQMGEKEEPRHLIGKTWTHERRDSKNFVNKGAVAKVTASSGRRALTKMAERHKKKGPETNTDGDLQEKASGEECILSSLCPPSCQSLTEDLMTWFNKVAEFPCVVLHLKVAGLHWQSAAQENSRFSGIKMIVLSNRTWIKLKSNCAKCWK